MIRFDIGTERIIQVREHEPIGIDELEKPLCDKILSDMGNPDNCAISDVKFLGLKYDFYQKRFFANYYVGVDWLDKKRNIALEVLPKFGDVDFQKMFMTCFELAAVVDPENLNRIFVVRDDDRPICIPSRDFQLDPLLIIYFLRLVEAIAKRGLRSDYVTREERLNGKVKGKILIGRYIRHGILEGRADEIDCRFQEYSKDCLDNRILKKALLLTRQWIEVRKMAFGVTLYDSCVAIYNKVITAFEGISDEVNARDLVHMNVSLMFRQYKSALVMAKCIIRNDGMGLSAVAENGTQMVPPFCIDMSLLFELYVYAMLRKRYDGIDFQKGTRRDRPDFMKPDEHLILDTKYKEAWQSDGVSDDIRQLSGYARNVRIRRSLNVGDDATICPCMILYPDNAEGVEGFDEFGDAILDVGEYPQSRYVKTVGGYIHFYKLPVRLPVLR